MGVGVSGAGVVDVGVGLCVEVGVGVKVSVGKGVKVSVGVGGAKVFVAVTGTPVSVGVFVAGTGDAGVAVGGAGVGLAGAVGVAEPGALRIAMTPAQ
ncbi:MAG TPA: hypothetical protein VLL77_00020 [Anaerolineales bacterium]|nr:hypothetical protein [Anaerolineales bacterium]